MSCVVVDVFACLSPCMTPQHRLDPLLCHIGSAGQNKQHLVTKNTAKLDRETEELHHERVPLEVGKVIQLGRQEKGMTQKDLATVSIQTSHKLTCTQYITAAGKHAFVWICKTLFTLVMYVGESRVWWVK